MTLYEIDMEILSCVDPESGEIIDFEKLEELQIQREEKIEKVALWYKNLVSDAEALKAEKTALAEREAAARQKAESLKKWLTDALNGSKMSTPKVAIAFRKSESVEVDEAEFAQWVQINNRDDLLTYKDPTPNKTAIKAAIKSGQSISGASIVEKNNIQIK
jgi:uncharacterized protein YqcC (DUF446 family)